MKERRSDDLGRNVMEDRNVFLTGGLINSEVDTYYTLPLVRYSTGMRCLALVDLVTVVALWLAGGESSYLKESILHFNFLTSVFDVSAIATVKTIAIFIILEKLETISMALLERPNRENNDKKYAYHIFLSLLCLVPFIFFVIKGAFVLHNYLNSAMTMHLQCNVSLVSAVTFAALELLLACGSHHFMKRLQLLRIRHVFGVERPQRQHKRTASFKRFIFLFKDEWLLILIATIFITVVNVLAPLQTKYTGMAMDDALESLDKFKTTMLILGGIYLCHFLCSGIKALCFHFASQKLIARWRTVAFRKLMKQGMEFYYENMSGEFASRLSGDIAIIQRIIQTGSLIEFFVCFVQIGLALYNMFAINPKMTGVFLAFTPLWITNITLYGRWQKKLWHVFQAKLAKAVATAEVYINTVWTVKCLGEERQSIDKYSEDIHQSYLVGRKVAVVNGLCAILNYGVGYLTMMGVLLYGGHLLNGGELSPGDFTSMIMYVQSFSSLMNNQQEAYGAIMEAYGSSLRLIEIIDLKVEGSDEDSIQSEMSFDEISFQDVHYSFCTRPERSVLNGVSFTVRKGEVVAMVGPSGGGKSTIASLIPRLSSSGTGKITIDNVDINTMDSGCLRRHVTLVDQASMLSSGTIRENMTRTKDVSMAEIEQASRCAQVHDFITSLQDGYDTLVGERGMLLSGGEKQRIVIARALLTRPKVLILDEATSYLDAAMEDIILIAVGRAITAIGGIVIFMSNKLAVVNTASRVMLVNGGKTRELNREEVRRLKESARQSLASYESISWSVDLEKVTFRNARSEDARQIWEWTESVNWNESLQDIQLYCDILSEGFLVAEIDGKLVGCTFYTHIGGDQTFGGFTLVESALRGKGIGRKLFKERFRRIGERNFGVNAVAERVQPNIKMGYKHTTWKLRYYHGTFSFALEPKNPGRIQICELSDQNIDQVLEYDIGVHVFPREKFLRAWFGRKNVKTHVAFVDGKVVGYGLLSPATIGYRLAPLYADTQDAALTLIDSLVKALPTGSDVALYVPEDNKDAMEIAQSENMVLALDPIVRQYTKWDVELPLQKVYGFANLDTTML